MAWQIDPSHSAIHFSVRHMMLSTARGVFDSFSGQVDFDEANPANSSVRVEIQADSINTKDEQRDGHLKSPDFLNVEKYPALTFKSTRIEVLDDYHGRIYGDLTIREVTKEVVLDTEYIGKVRSPWGTNNVGFAATTVIDRRDWGLVWNVALETGGVLVGDKITINIELEMVEQAQEELAAAAS